MKEKLPFVFFSSNNENNQENNISNIGDNKNCNLDNENDFDDVEGANYKIKKQKVIMKI